MFNAKCSTKSQDPPLDPYSRQCSSLLLVRPTHTAHAARTTVAVCHTTSVTDALLRGVVGADVIKVRQQASNLRLGATVRGVMQADGVRGFWRGTIPGLAMVRSRTEHGRSVSELV